eukprot:TRINITY_DN38886_c0_g1_i1.p1 TRINITY_DN38886_c0_g1~~TRINITY_DN38886_c0_g1_i1.p1  ORF type:complete len:115 (-),score=25.86 TRINITY_DN38886_c0_g1_i1:70-414(-)
MKMKKAVLCLIHFSLKRSLSTTKKILSVEASKTRTFNDLSHINVTGTLMEEEPENPCRPVDISEIEFAIKQANPCKSLGADVFNVHFFKVCRPIVGCDVSDAIKDFFVEGKLLR